MLTVENTYIFSVLIQIVSLVIFFLTYELELPPEKVLLKNAYKLEIYVSVIELLGYLVLGYYINTKTNLTALRYGDWFITTSFLLVSLSKFLLYNKLKNNNVDDEKTKENLKKYDFKHFVGEYSKTLVNILCMNTAMLVLGLMGEIKYMNAGISLIIGMILFLMTFHSIFKNFVGTVLVNQIVFSVFVFIWFFYAVAYVADFKTKNIAYNILDLISKNLFGVFLYFFIMNN